MKKFLSHFLAVILACSVITLTAVAAFAADDSPENYPEPSSSNAAYSGGQNAGITPDEIKWMQTALNYCIKYRELDAELLDVDGDFGPASERATMAFQEKYGLTADGCFGPDTIAEMKSVLSESSAPTYPDVCVRKMNHLAAAAIMLYANCTDDRTILDSGIFNYTAFRIVGLSVKKDIAEGNLEHNFAFDEMVEEREYLINQMDSFYTNLVYGLGFTHDEVGCELMAMYNALKLTGHPVSYSQLTYQAETIGGAQMLYGAFGTNPYMMGKLLTKNGATVTQYYSAQALDAAMQVGDVAVVSGWNDRYDITWGLHTYTVQKTSSGLLWYNFYTNKDEVLPAGEYDLKNTIYSTLTATDSAYITGYIVK